MINLKEQAIIIIILRHKLIEIFKKDFADLIRMNLLIPYPKTFYEHVLKKPDTRERDSSNPFLMRRRSSAEDFKKPIEMAKERLNKKTNFWPMTIGGSLLFPMSVVRFEYTHVSDFKVKKSGII